MKKNILYIILFGFLITLNIFVGPSIRDPLLILNIIPLVITIIYLIYCFIRKKEFLIISNKIDILIIIFLLLPFISFIFKNYISLSSQWERILQNISVLSMYFFIKNICKDKNINIIINIIIFSTIPIIVIGIDRLCCGNIWNYLVSKFNIFDITFDSSNRMVSNFNYPNTLAIYLSSIIFLILGQIKNNKKSIIYGTYLFILLLFVFLTESRASILLLIIFFIMYLFFVKNKLQIKRILSIFLTNISTIILYFVLTQLLNIKSKGLLLLIILLIIFNFLINLIFYKVEKCVRTINNKKLFIGLSVLVFCIITYFIVGFNCSKPFNIISNSEFYRIDIKKNKKYNFKIDLNSELKTKTNRFGIVINGVDKYFNTVVLVNDSFENYNGVKEYDFYVDDDIEYINVVFNNYYGNEMIINNLYINNKEYILNYKYLPNSLIDKFKLLSFENKSVSERISTYKDSLKLLKNNWLFGNGYESWQYMYRFYQSYNYSVNIMHSFIFDILISFGIFGIIILFLIILFIILDFKKIINNNKSYLSVIFSISILMVHSLIDFDMSFLVVYFYLFILFSLLLYKFKDKCYIKQNNLLNLILLSIFISSFILNVNNKYVDYKVKNINSISYEDRFKEYQKLYKIYPYSLDLNYYKLFYESNSYLNDLINDDQLEQNFIKDLKFFINNEPHYEQYEVQKLYINYINKKLNEGVIDKNNILYLRKILEKNNLVEKFDLSIILRRAELLIDLCNSYNEYYLKTNNEFIKNESDKIQDMIYEEYNLNMKNLKNYKKVGYKKQIYDEFIGEYTNLIK